MLLWDENTHDLLTQCNTFIISRVKSTSWSKGILSDYLRTMVRESMYQEPVSGQTTICVLAVVGRIAPETLVER